MSLKSAFDHARTGKAGLDSLTLLFWIVAIDDDRQKRERRKKRRNRLARQTRPAEAPKGPSGPRPF